MANIIIIFFKMVLSLFYRYTNNNRNPLFFSIFVQKLKHAIISVTAVRKSSFMDRYNIIKLIISDFIFSNTRKDFDKTYFFRKPSLSKKSLIRPIQGKARLQNRNSNDTFLNESSDCFVYNINKSTFRGGKAAMRDSVFKANEIAIDLTHLPFIIKRVNETSVFSNMSHFSQVTNILYPFFRFHTFDMAFYLVIFFYFLFEISFLYVILYFFFGSFFDFVFFFKDNFLLVSPFFLLTNTHHKVLVFIFFSSLFFLLLLKVVFLPDALILLQDFPFPPLAFPLFQIFFPLLKTVVLLKVFSFL